jgi:hypothetical protein
VLVETRTGDRGNVARTIPKAVAVDQATKPAIHKAHAAAIMR